MYQTDLEDPEYLGRVKQPKAPAAPSVRAGALASDVIDTLPAAQERLRQALEAATARR